MKVKKMLVNTDLTVLFPYFLNLGISAKKLFDIWARNHI